MINLKAYDAPQRAAFQNRIHNGAKIDPKSTKMNPWAVLDRKSCPGRLQDAPPSSGYLAFYALFRGNVAPRLDFWTPGDPAEGSEIDI